MPFSLDQSEFGGPVYDSTGGATPGALDQTQGFTGLWNSITGVLSKTVETAEDQLQYVGAQKLVGAVYPSGQHNPDIKATVATEKKPVDYKPYLIAGGIAVGLILITALIVRKAS